MAKYNQWMNRRLYALCAELSDGDRRQPANPVNKADNQPITLPTIARQMRHFVSWDMV